MKAASLQEIKQALVNLSPKEILNLSLRLSRFKKENKELLTYLLFEANNEAGYVQSIKEEMDEIFSNINLSQLYFAKKTLRKIIRLINKYSRYSNVKETDIELRIHFCQGYKNLGLPIKQNTVLANIYNAQVKKIETQIKLLAEDLQYDYRKALETFE